MKRTRLILILIFLATGCVVIPAVSVSATITSNVNGSINVSSVSTDIHTPRVTESGMSLPDSLVTSNSLNQNYTINWYRNLSYYLLARANLSYNRLGIDVNSGNSWREEWRPGAELIYNHPRFTLNGLFQKNISETNFDFNNYEHELYSVNFNSKFSRRYPVFQLKYDHDRNYNPDSLQIRNIRYNRFLANTTYNYKNNSFFYSFITRKTDNKATDISSWDNNHVFRWNQLTRFMDNRLRISSGYLLTHSSVKTEFSANSFSLDLIPFNQILYAEDLTPELGELVPVTGLSDGNITLPTDPVVDIGDASLFQNIGADLGINREISGFYVYTNRPSGNSMSWQVYVSTNNLNWQVFGDPVSAAYDLLTSRYELVFETVTARYVKVVNISVNTSDTVYVTEVQPVVAIAGVSESKRESTSHLLDLNAKYQHTEKLDSRADINYRNEQNNSNLNEKSDITFAYSLRYRATEKLTHMVGVQMNRLSIGIDKLNSTSRDVNYNIYYTPYDKLSLSTVLQNKRYSVGGNLETETNGIFTNITGSMLPTLHLSSDLSFSRNNQLANNRIYHTFSGRISVNGDITRNMEFMLSALYRYSKTLHTDQSINQRNYASNINYRVTRSIYFRGTLTLTKDNNTYLQHDYTLSWVLSSRMSISGIAGFTSWGENRTGTRLSASGNLTIKKRGKLFVSYSNNDFFDLGGLKTNTFQIGYKTGF